jgi:hypothetical protein
MGLEELTDGAGVNSAHERQEFLAGCQLPWLIIIANASPDAFAVTRVGLPQWPETCNKKQTKNVIKIFSSQSRSISFVIKIYIRRLVRN